MSYAVLLCIFQCMVNGGCGKIGPSVPNHVDQEININQDTVIIQRLRIKAIIVLVIGPIIAIKMACTFRLLGEHSNVMVINVLVG